MTKDAQKQPQIILHKGVFQERQVVMIYFEYKQSIIEVIQTFRGAWWDPDFRCWCIPQDVFDLNWFILVMEPLADIDHSRLNEGTSSPGPIMSNQENIRKQATKKTEKNDVQLPSDYIKKLE